MAEVEYKDFDQEGLDFLANNGIICLQKLKIVTPKSKKYNPGSIGCALT